MTDGGRSTTSLNGLHCLVLRPRGQAGELSALLRERGAVVTHFPTIAIEPLQPAAGALAAVSDADYLVFISPNAVDAGITAIHRAGVALPEGATVVAVGGGTARALRGTGVQVDVEPSSGGGSDALLRHPRLQSLAGAAVVIVRGEGGREHLAETLAERGAKVTYLEVYRRTLPRLSDPAGLLAGWRSSAARVTIVTSVTGWRHLLELAGAEARGEIVDCALVAVSERVVAAARADGHRGPAVTAVGPGPAALAEAAGEAYRRITENGT